MSIQWTQFAVAVLGMATLGIGTIVAIVGNIWNDTNSELTFALITALTGVTAGATAYLFRLNGRS